ncbi:MAG: toll/interleukin-1 receptor domain-containing protein [Candidatus Hydrogenedentes bacterium]|nr:toll/interleukin-1 receptor domain-containing protein [Candidatus Hydrogenedentota bacterium]
MNCPQCDSANVMFSKKRMVHICEDCGHEFTFTKPTTALRIFLSYGHDDNEELVRRIKGDLEARGHDVWFDKSPEEGKGIRAGDDWRRAITDGIAKCQKFVSFLSKHSTRDPGVCRDEIAIAIGVKGGNIQTILVESEQEVQAPVNIGHIQWLDMHDWKIQRAAGAAEWEQRRANQEHAHGFSSPTSCDV